MMRNEKGENVKADEDVLIRKNRLLQVQVK